jgi:DNA polymerase III delta prime subunit
VNNLKEQGIQYFRNEMKTFCQSRSAIHGKKKLVIIDDIDTINEQSQQVFRNYIDKYKQNVHLISVCTNIQKVIESIQSRVHILQIKPLAKEQVRNIMERIIQSEGIVIDEAAKDYLLLSSANSIRMVINYLEKIYILGDPVSLESCKRICSNISFQRFEEFIENVKAKELSLAIDSLYSIYDYGYSVIDILDYFFLFVKMTSLIDEDTKYKIIPFLCKYITIFHNVHEDGIELALFTNNLIQCISD